MKNGKNTHLKTIDEYYRKSRGNSANNICTCDAFQHWMHSNYSGSLQITSKYSLPIRHLPSQTRWNQPSVLFVSVRNKMWPCTQRFEIQRGSRPAKSLKAGELTGSSWIKLPKSRQSWSVYSDYYTFTKRLFVVKSTGHSE